jgi:hypothetical protein
MWKSTLTFFLVLVFQQETTLFLQLLYQNNFKDDFSLSLKDRYEQMIISAVHDREYMENYKHLDMNLDRGMHAHFQLHTWYFLIPKMLRLSYLRYILLPNICKETVHIGYSKLRFIMIGEHLLVNLMVVYLLLVRRVLTTHKAAR